MEKESNKKQSWKVLIPSIICIAFGIGFSVYVLTSVSSNEYESMNSKNVTANCDISGYVLSKNADKNPYGVPSDIKANAEKAWSKYNCQGLVLGDTFGNNCYGSVGFTYYSMRQDGVGLFYCSNIDKSLIDLKVQQEQIK